MLLKIEAREPTLIYLYNLLVGELNKPIPPPDAPRDTRRGAELTNLLAVTDEALSGALGDSQWFACVKEGCDHRPFVVTRGQVEDAEKVISCDVCGELCHRIPEESLQKRLV
ncbi:MAG: hypothetical protein KJ077_45910 [Anaerolineae bacterium]|nr:hypothetical protein [Anaerolineae bacterium]